MYLVLSALASSPVSLVAATKASSFSFRVCIVPPSILTSSAFYVQNVTNILLSNLISYANVIIGDHQCGCGRNRSTNYPIFCVRDIREKKMGIQ